MGIYLIWFSIAMVLIFIEMNIMSFYLIAVAIGCIAGGLAAYFEQSIDLQFTYAGIAVIIASSLAYFLRKSLKRKQDKMNDNLDMGQRVQIQTSDIKADGTATVVYRGTTWQAFQENTMLTPGVYTIYKIVGTQLKLDQKIGEINESEQVNKSEQSNKSHLSQENSSLTQADTASTQEYLGPTENLMPEHKENDTTLKNK